MFSSRYLALGVPIVLFWLVMTGLLFHREQPNRRLELGAAPPLELPRQMELGLFQDDSSGRRQLGTVRLDQSAESRDGGDGVLTETRVDLNLSLFGRPARVDVEGATWAGPPDRPVDLEFEIRSGPSRFAVQAALHEGRLRGTVETGSQSHPIDVPLSGDLFPSGGVGSPLAFPRLKLGDEVQIETFDPLSLGVSTAELRASAYQQIEIAGRSVRALVVDVDMSGFETRSWLDDSGEVLRATTPLGLILERVSWDEEEAGETTSIATSNDRSPLPESRPEPGDDVRDSADAAAPSAGLLDQVAIRPSGTRPTRGARRLELLVGGGSFELPSDVVQRKIGDNRYVIATHANEQAPQPSAEEIEEALGSDPFVQSDAPQIVELADLLTEGLRDPTERAAVLSDWVYRSLAKVPVLGVPSALEVLESRQGDCNEHTVLFAALARAAELPTRIAVGLVWSDDLGGFYYHAWPEVWLGERWLWIDPTLDQLPADATHLKLLNGGIESWSRILPTLGSLEIEVLEAS